jgi:hypothetical protein
MKKKLVLKISILFLLFTLSNVSNGQVSIYGHVVDEEKRPIPVAGVFLKTLPDSTVLKADITNEYGSFNIASAFPGMLLEIKSVGYKPWVMIIGDSVKQNIIIPEIVLTPSQTLNSITVIASKPLIEHKLDRMILNVGSSILNIGNDVYDLLKNAPGVTASDNNGISIAGKSTVSLMINDKLQPFNGAELIALLRSIPAENVDRIEIITTPPARYDAQGNAGLINIVTKKASSAGFSGNISASYQQRFRNSEKISENLNYRNGKVSIYSNGNSNYFNFQSVQETVIPFETQIQSQVLNQVNNPFYNRYAVGIDVNLTSRAIIGATYTLSRFKRQTNQLYNATVTGISTGAIDSVLRTITDEKEKNSQNSINLNYEWHIDTGKKQLNIDADYYIKHEDISRYFTTLSFLQNGELRYLPLNNLTAGVEGIKVKSLKVDFVFPLSAMEISIGSKISAIASNSDNRFAIKVSNYYEENPDRTILFDYTENVQAGYVSLKKDLGKWKYQTGLRAEITHVTGISNGSNSSFTSQYLKFFPTAFLQYQFKFDNILSINYSKRIERPTFSELSPFLTYGVGGSYDTGNPLLQPSFYNNLEIRWSLKSKYIFAAYAGLEDNTKARVSYIDNAMNTFYFTNENIGRQINYGISATVIYNQLQWWECNIYLQGYYNRIISAPHNIPAYLNGITAFHSRVNNVFVINKPKTLSAEVGFQYFSPSQYNLTIQNEYYILDVGLKFILFDKRFVLGFNGTDILRTEKYQQRNIYNNLFQKSYFDARCFTVLFNWKFGSHRIKYRHETFADTDEIRRSR